MYFEIVNTDIGGGWLASNNLFFAPVDGVYVFSASMRSYSESYYAYCNIVMYSVSTGETIVASISDYTGGRSSGSNSAIIVLKQGDTVAVKLRGDDASRIYSTASLVHSTFSGFLLFA